MSGSSREEGEGMFFISPRRRLRGKGEASTLKRCNRLGFRFFEAEKTGTFAHVFTAMGEQPGCKSGKYGPRAVRANLILIRAKRKSVCSVAAFSCGDTSS